MTVSAVAKIGKVAADVAPDLQDMCITREITDEVCKGRAAPYGGHVVQRRVLAPFRYGACPEREQFRALVDSPAAEGRQCSRGDSGHQCARGRGEEDLASQ